MGFGGSVAGMLASLKSNKRARPDTFKKMKGVGNVKYSELYFEKKATPHQLKKIREKMQAENRKIFRNRIILFSVFIFLIIYFLGFYKF